MLDRQAYVIKIAKYFSLFHTNKKKNKQKQDDKGRAWRSTLALGTANGFGNTSMCKHWFTGAYRYRCQRTGHPQHLTMSHVTKGSALVLVLSLSERSAVNVTGHNGECVFQNEFWIWGLGGQEEPLKVAVPGFKRPGGRPRSQALFGLGSGFLLPLLPCASCPSRHKQSGRSNNFLPTFLPTVSLL